FRTYAGGGNISGIRHELRKGPGGRLRTELLVARPRRIRPPGTTTFALGSIRPAEGPDQGPGRSALPPRGVGSPEAPSVGPAGDRLAGRLARLGRPAPRSPGG